MATLNSPGVSVSVIDESFYLPAAPGTVPLLIVASQANKMNSAGTGIAPGTLAANAGRVYLLTSQQDLGNTFGIPYFQTDAENNPINASEVNEYGLQAAYSFLGVSNRAYVVRANVDTKQLIGNANIPTSSPNDGAYWFDIADTNFGIFQWNSAVATTSGGQTFTNQGSINNLSYITSTLLMDGSYTPLSSFGALGDYALTGNSASTDTVRIIKLWFKKYQTDTAAGTWVEVGSPSWIKSWATITATTTTSSWSAAAVSLTINGTTNIGASSTSPSTLATAINGASITGVTAAVINGYLQIYSNGTTTGSGSAVAGAIAISGTGLTTLGLTAGTYNPPAFQMSPHFSVPAYSNYGPVSGGNGYTPTSGYPTGSVWIKTTSVNLGANYFVKKYNAATSSWITQATQLFPNGHSALATLDPTGGGINLPLGTIYAKYNDSEAGTTTGLTNSGGYFRTKLYTRTGVGATTITSIPIANSTFYTGGGIATASATGIIGSGTGTGAGTVFTPTGTVTGTYTAGMVLTGTGVTSSPATSILTVNSATFTATFPNNTLSGVTITGTGGQFQCTTTTLYTGMQVTISGTYGGTGSISGYSSPTTYVISATNGTTTFTLTTIGGAAIVSTAGTPTGITYTLSNVISLTVSAGTVSVGQVLTGGGVTAGSYIRALGSGTGGTGTYLLNQTATGTPTGAISYTVNQSQTVASTLITGTATSETYSFTIQESQTGSTSLTSPITVTFSATGNATSDANAFLTAFQSVVTDSNITATLGGTSTSPTIVISHLAGGDIRFADGTNTPLATLFSLTTTANWYSGPTGTGYIASLWSGASFASSSVTSPTNTPANGTLWYNNSLINFDIMINNGSAWVGYKDTTAAAMLQAVGGGSTDPNGPIVSATQPTVQSSASVNPNQALANGDIWINTSNLEDFPNINVYNYQTKLWVRVNNQDHTSSAGIVFADARWNADGGVTLGDAPSSIASLLTSNFVDFDCVSPALYPKGTLLFNTRRSDFNVKQYEVGYVNTQTYNTMYQNTLMTNYYTNRWVTAAPNNTHGVAQLGRFAQRAVVLKALEATIQSNTNIRQPDTVIYNLLACPGYLEAASALVALNTDNGQTAFIIHDAPARLTPDATTLSNWGNNTGGAAIDGEDGLIFTDPYSAVYYPWGYTSDLMGNNIVVPPSHIMLRTIALSDNVSYPWFAPAGVRRGGVTNASSVGYVDKQTGEFRTVALNTGQRDTMASIHVNPITYIAGTGLVVYGQKTRQLVASSLDRINVARLVCYLRYQLNQLAKPYIFEPNDKITRTQIKNEVDKLMIELTAERALYDFLVVCDTSNNTPSRIDKNELHVDIAIEPVKAVEFIYIPLRLENTGAIASLS